jgi:hypothetical protein
MAGPDPTGAFQGDVFQADIRAVMLMGLPNTAEDRPTFLFSDTRQHAEADDEGSPFDWESTPTVGEPPADPVQVLCAVEPIGQGEASEGTNIGTFDMNRARLYLFDEEWEQVANFTSVLLSGSEYMRTKELPTLGLFDVDVHVVEVYARDES